MAQINGAEQHVLQEGGGEEIWDKENPRFWHLIE